MIPAASAAIAAAVSAGAGLRRFRCPAKPGTAEPQCQLASGSVTLVLGLKAA